MEVNQHCAVSLASLVSSDVRNRTQPVTGPQPALEVGEGLPPKFSYVAPAAFLLTKPMYERCE